MAASQGYQQDFIGTGFSVPFPKLSAVQKKDIAGPTGVASGELTYLHFSIFLSKKRRFPYFTATNIDGTLFKKAGRSDKWILDPRVTDFQYGNSLYSAPHSDYDKGHMTKREDPQWGDTVAIAQQAADATFHFANSVPQVPELNRQEWKQLEDYILDKECVPSHLKICVFTGPVLKDDDPVFVSKVNNQDVLIPTLFWKVVYYTNDGKSLSKVGFLMGQENLLRDKGIVNPIRTKKLVDTHLPGLKKHFTDFKDAETYQVNMATIENLTGLTFPPGDEPKKDNRPIQLIIKQVEMKEDHTKSILGSTGKAQSLNGGNFRYEGILLR